MDAQTAARFDGRRGPDVASACLHASLRVQACLHAAFAAPERQELRTEPLVTHFTFYIARKARPAARTVFEILVFRAGIQGNCKCDS